MNFGTCKLCNRHKELVKAHVIPRSFMLKAKGQSKQLLEVRRNDAKEVLFWQNGIWDDQILCRDCEDGFTSWDDYGCRILRTPPGKNIAPETDPEVRAFIIDNIDYRRLKLFVLSVLWRSSVSSKPFFTRVKLGQYQSMIADMLLNQDAGSHDQFPVVLARLVNQELPTAIYAPYRHRSPEGVNFNVIFLPSIKILIKTDQRPLPPIFEPVALKPQPENILIPMTLHSNELRTVDKTINIVRKWHSNRNAS